MTPHLDSHQTIDRPRVVARPRRSRGAFTLVELLVVIGIIALLIGVLLPALTAARKQAATVKCLSALREIGVAFNLYANFYKDAFPVVRQDTPDDGLPGPSQGGPGRGPENLAPPVGQNRYYTDMLMPFIAKGGRQNFEVSGTNASDRLAFEETRKSVLWGCPEWDGWRGTGGDYINGIHRFDNGYSMNFFPTFTARYPAGVALPPGTEVQMRTTVFTFGGKTAVGKYFRRSQWTKPSERLLMVDSTLWYLGFFPTNATTLPPQAVARGAAASAGESNIDRYRHGKRPPITGAFYSNRGGRVGFNVLYVDGHAATLKDYREGYKAIRMRNPGPP